MQVAGHFTFGRGSAGETFLGDGWSHREIGFSWTEGFESRMRLPFVQGSGTLFMEIGVNPMLVLPHIKSQRLIVAVNGVVVAQEEMRAETALSLEIPAAALRGADLLEVLLQCPDAMVPAEHAKTADTRRLGFAVREILLLWAAPRPAFTPRVLPPLPDVPGGLGEAVRGVTGLSIAALGACFESLGHDCEFGLAQRRMGVESLGLLRFSGISPLKLLEALDFEFEGIDSIDNLYVYSNEMAEDGLLEFIVRDLRYGSQSHSHMSPLNTDAAAVAQVFGRRLKFLRRKMLGDLQAAHKIFVFHHPGARSLAQIRPLMNLLRSYGPNYLLFVTDDNEHAPGAVQQIDTDLFRGWVGALVPAHDVPLRDMPPWISVCANAYRLWRLSGHGPEGD